MANASPDMDMDALQTIYVHAQLALALDAELQDQNQMSRLREKLAQAKGVVKRVSDEIEAEADALLAREQIMRSQTASAFAGHKEMLADARSGLDELESELRQFTNGGPPLDDSEPASNVSEQVPPENPTEPQP